MLEKLNINKAYPTSKGNYTNSTNRKIQWIVIHYTGGAGTGLGNVKYFQNNGNAQASAHFFVGHKSENGQIYQGVDIDDTAWHCGTKGMYYNISCRNSNSIGIEVACHNDTKNKTAESKDWYFDKETVDSLVELVKALMADYNIDVNHVIRHYDVTHKICPAPWVHNVASWQRFKARLIDSVDEHKKIIQARCKFSHPDGVWEVLDKHKYAEALYQQWADSYK